MLFEDVTELAEEPLEPPGTLFVLALTLGKFLDLPLKLGNPLLVALVPLVTDVDLRLGPKVRLTQVVAEVGVVELELRLFGLELRLLHPQCRGCALQSVHFRLKRLDTLPLLRRLEVGPRTDPFRVGSSGAIAHFNFFVSRLRDSNQGRLKERHRC